MDEGLDAAVRVSELRAGRDIGGYRVIELVGAGGMGRVYRALHIPLQRIVALKVIRPEIASDERFRERFRREARLVASIDHPAVVPVYDADEIDGVLFIAMRWVSGSDLRRVLAADGPLDPVRAVRLLTEIAGAVDAAHEAGLIHRDIKPANVMLEGDRAFLSDFGLARLLAGADAATVTGGFMGTVDYAAPELLDGEPGTGRADIYALGCVLYEMLTGSVPFPIEGLLGKLHAHAHDERPAPTARRPDLPRGLDGVVRRALAIDPAARFSRAGELSVAAERALRTPPARRPVSARERRRWRRMLFIAPLLAAAVALAVILTLLSPSPRSAYASGGRKLPAPSSLHHCGDVLTGPPRMCAQNHNDGVLEVGDQGTAVRMSTMNVQVTGIAFASVLHVYLSGGELTAPPGTRFVLIDLTVTNVTHAQQEFEPSEAIDGRQTGLWLIGANGKTLPSYGPHYADYTVQDGQALGVVQQPLFQEILSPGLPASGQLVFYYPTTELREAKRIYLEVHELREPFNLGKSVALIRLRP